MKKKTIALFVTVLTLAVSSIAVFADSPIFKGEAIYWDYGRCGFLWTSSYSDVQTTLFWHSATANSDATGWIEPGTLAHAQCYIGTKTAHCYWNCK